LCGTAIYTSAFADAHCAYPRKDDEAELTWVAGYIPRWFAHMVMFIHPNINQVQRKVT